MFFARIVVSVLAFGIANQLGFLMLAWLFPGIDGAAFVASLLALPIGLAGAVFAWKLPMWRSATLPATTIASMVRGASMVGGIGFCAGFFGPMILAPDANQGPLVGIFITGPLGAVVGAIGGFVRSRIRQSSAPAR